MSEDDRWIMLLDPRLSMRIPCIAPAEGRDELVEMGCEILFEGTHRECEIFLLERRKKV